jgi:CheY-like chemotaxis protein
VLVLIADQDLAVRDAARRAVERFGYRCAAVSNGAEAWDRIVADAPDVVLASLGLAVIDGVELCRRARELQRTPASYLVAMVGEDDGEGLFAAMANGADDFLTRPLRAEQLHASHSSLGTMEMGRRIWSGPAGRCAPALGRIA